MDILIEKKDWKIHWPQDVKELLWKMQDWYYMMSLRKWAKRTLEQNSYYWKILTLIAQDTWNEAEDLHKYFKMMFLKRISVHEVLWEITEIISTTRLTTKTFTDYVDKVVNWCLEHGYEIPLDR